MKRFFSIFLTSVFLFTGTISVFAEGSVDENNSTTDLVNSGISNVQSTNESSGGDESISSGGNESVSTGPITVDVSENSVNAIAQAVFSNTSEMTVTNKHGETYTVPSVAIDRFNSSPYKFFTIYTNGALYWFFSDEPIKVKPNEDLYTYGFTYYFKSTSSDSWSGPYTGGYNRVLGNVKWSNYDIYDDDGNFKYANDVGLTYTIYFETGFDDLVVDNQKSDSFLLPDISYDGYKFDGWYFDKGTYTLPVTVDTVFSEDTTVYAKWIPYRTISFVTGIDGFELSSVKVLSGEQYTPPLFQYAGYSYIGAYTDENRENQFVGGTVINDDLTLYLKFEPIVYDMGALLTQQVELSKGLQVIQGQLWIVLVVGLIYFVYKFFRMFF